MAFLGTLWQLGSSFRRIEESRGKPHSVPHSPLTRHTELSRKLWAELFTEPRSPARNISLSRPRWRLFVFAAVGKGWPGGCQTRQMSGRFMINCEELRDGCWLRTALLSRVNLIKMIWRISIDFYFFSDRGPHTGPGATCVRSGSGPVSRLRI